MAVYKKNSREGKRAETEPSPQPSRRRAESTTDIAEKGNEPRPSRVHSRADDEPNPQPTMFHGPTAVTVAVRIIPHHTMYPLVAGVASLTNVIRGVPLYHPSWLKVRKERKAALIADIGTQFHLRPHMESPDWTEIHAGIQQYLQKAYNTNKAAFKAQHWVIDPTTGTYNVEKIRWARSYDIPTEEWDKYIQFWNDPRNIARAAKNRQNQAKSTRESSATQEYPSLIDTFFVAHTINGEFLRDEDRRIYEEMRRLEAIGTYTDDEINRLAKGGKQQGHIPSVGRVLPARATASPSTPAHESTLTSLQKKVDFMMSLFKSDSKYSDMFSQFEPGSASGSGGCGDDEERTDDQDDEDEDVDVYSPATCRRGKLLCRLQIKKCRTFPSDKSPRKAAELKKSSSLPGDMSPRNMCHRDTNYLTEKYIGPIISLGNVSCRDLQRTIPSDKSLSKGIQATCRWGKPRNVAGECG
nr:F-box domain, leucine-rich repeat domain, L domain-like protein [Tanacetum cinerariifolium]